MFPKNDKIAASSLVVRCAPKTKKPSVLSIKLALSLKIGLDEESKSL